MPASQLNDCVSCMQVCNVQCNISLTELLMMLPFLIHMTCGMISCSRRGVTCQALGQLCCLCQTLQVHICSTNNSRHKQSCQA